MESSSSTSSSSMESSSSSSTSSSSSMESSSFTSSSLSKEFIFYYKEFFPWEALYKWLSYGNGELFARREFSFTVTSARDSQRQTFSRHNWFLTEEMFRDAFHLPMKTAKGGVPEFIERFEIGSVYTMTPSDPTGRRQPYSVPESREFVLDIDMDDYDAIRNCCSGATICTRCWTFLACAMKVLESLLEFEFGFCQRLWVFSGRRGVHCWVCDDTARSLSKRSRRTIIDFLSIFQKKKSPEEKDKFLLTFPLNPTFDRLYTKILKPFFEERILPTQDLLVQEKTLAQILNHFPAEVATEFRLRWAGDFSFLNSRERWNDLESVPFSMEGLYMIKVQIVFEYTYPRLDRNVSIDVNHLLKSPFCVHPITTFISIPIDPQWGEHFNPTVDPPKLLDLIEKKEDATQSFNNALMLFENFIKN